MRTKRLIIPCLCLLVAGNATARPFMPILKSDTTKHVTGTVKAKDHADTAKAGQEQQKKEPESEYQKLLKNQKSHREGLFTLRNLGGKWCFEIPEDKLGKPLLVVTRFTSVPANFAKNIGEEVSENVVYFEKRDDKTMLLRGYSKTQKAGNQDDIADAVGRATVDPIITRFTIAQDNGNGTSHGYLVDATAFLLRDNSITGLDNSSRKALKVGGQVAELCYVDTIKAYPINIEVSTIRTYSMEPTNTVPASQTAGTVTLSLNTSMVELPDDVMRPRLADERVGYFTTGYTRFSDYGKTERNQIVSRYKLVPKNKQAYLSGKLTEPEKQIVYYIDPATPKKWVPYLKAGINDWNKAFEAAGFKNAIVAKDWPNDSTMSIDDARFSVLRYLPSQKANAYGPRIVDPRSGQIIESHICWYHNITDVLRQWYMVQCGPLDKRAQKYDFDEKLMGELIRFVSSHEVGHTLGLRHNMLASSATPVEKLRDKKWVERHGHTSSIMDYARFNYVAQPEDGVSSKGLFPRINDYDCWAIKWGYQWRPEFGDEYAEKKALRKEVTKKLAENPRLHYVGDEGRGWDPRSQTEDLGDNDMRANEYGMKNLKRVMANIEKWTEQPDGQYGNLRDIYGEVLSQYSRYCGHVQRWIAGRYTNNWPAEKHFDYVSKALQKEALQWLGRNVLTVPQWLYPESVVQKNEMEPEDRIQSTTSALVGFLLQPNLLNNLRKGGKYPVGEWLDDVMAEVWKPLGGMSDWDATHCRQNERAYVSSLKTALTVVEEKPTAQQTAARNSDVYIYLLQNMGKVENFINAELAKTAAGDVNNLHYRDMLVQIKKIRKLYEEGK